MDRMSETESITSAEAKYPRTETIVHAIDFASASKADYAALGVALDAIDVGVLSESGPYRSPDRATD